MPGATSTSLLLNIGTPDPDTGKFPVKATLDGAGSLQTSIHIPAEDLQKCESEPWNYGRKLGESVFADPDLRRALAYARGKNGQRVSVSLEIDVEAFAAQKILWERLIFTNGDEELAFAASSGFGLSRLIPSETPAAAPPAQGPFRLLLVIASPIELQDASEGSPMKAIDASAEIGNLRSAWDSLVRRGLLRATILGRVEDSLATSLRASGYDVISKAATLEAISDALSAFDSLHLICHGSFKDNTAHLLLEDPDGRSKAVTEQDFLPKLGERSLRLVFLQACQSAKRNPGSPNVFSGLAPKVALRAAAVVAMQDFVLMEDAKRFAQEFYDTLLATGSADFAANAGRRTLYRPDSGNWAIPALFLAPKAEPLWQPDAILAAVQDLAAKFREKPDVAAPFPIEVVRLGPGISTQMETSPPGPRVRLPDAVSSALFPEKGDASPLVVIAGHYGRAKTAQLYYLYNEYASRVARGGPLPLLTRLNDFQPADVSSAEAVARAVAKTYSDFAGIELSISVLTRRLSQPFVLLVDGDQDADNRKRLYAFECFADLTKGRTDASVVITLDQGSLEQVPSLTGALASGSSDSEGQTPIFLVQLLSPANIAQYVNSLPGDSGRALLQAIEHSNLFDLAGVPWLLSSLIRQSNRSILSRSGVIARISNGNFAAVNLPPGGRRIVQDLLGRIAWTLQTHQIQRLAGSGLYEVLDEVRGRREIPLEQLRAAALETKMVCPSEDDGIRFAYPGFQSFWCAQYFLDSGAGIGRHLDDVTATLGRRSRIRLWEDTLVLLAGLMDEPDRLVRRILSGSSLGAGEQTFLAARCINEARLSGRPIAPDVSLQVLDNLILRSSSLRERIASIRIRATECLGLLRDPTAIPHLVSLVMGLIRPVRDGVLTFEVSGMRQAALQVLLTMQQEAEAYVRSLAADPNAKSSVQQLPELIRAWRAADSQALQAIFMRKDEGIPAICAFVLAALGDQNLEFLSEQIADPSAPTDTVWAIADAVLLFDPGKVTRFTLPRMRENSALHTPAAYIIGRLRIATPESEEAQFLNNCLRSSDAKTQGVALRSLAQLGDTRYRDLCEWVVTGRGTSPNREIPIPKKSKDRNLLRYYALESLRLIGTEATIEALRAARSWSADETADPQAIDLSQLSYQVTEDIYWRLTGGMEGDSYEPPSSPKIGLTAGARG